MILRNSVVLFACAALAAFVTARAWSDEPAKETAPGAQSDKSLDAQLLESLENELLEDAGSPPEADAKPSTTDDGEPAGEDVGEPSDQDPLSRVANRMKRVQTSIPRAQNPDKTSREQQQIVADLAKLIEQLEAQCKNAQSSSSKQPKPGSPSGRNVNQPKQPGGGQEGKQPASAPSRESTDKLRKDQLQKADMAALKNLMKDLWGQLPERVREQMLQSPPDEFLPEFELELEKFYKRLADEDHRER